MHSSHIGSEAHSRLYSHKRVYSQKPVRHQQNLSVHPLSRRTRRDPACRRQLNIVAASSTDQDVRRGNEATRSAQDLAQGVQDFLDESQKALSSDEQPLPEHPVGEEGTINVAEAIDASVGSKLTSCHPEQRANPCK